MRLRPLQLQRLGSLQLVQRHHLLQAHILHTVIVSVNPSQFTQRGMPLGTGRALLRHPHRLRLLFLHH